MNRACRRFCFCVAVVVVTAAGSVASAATVQEVFREAVAAYNAGDLAGARAKLELVLANDPAHPAARAWLKRVEMRETRPRSVEERVAAISLANTNFRDATLDSVLDHLSRKSSELAGPDAAGISFVSKLPREQMQARRVTLALANPVPMTEILRYVGELAGVLFRYETHAVVVEDAAAAPAPNP